MILTKRVSTHFFILLKEILKGLPQTGMRVVKKRIHEVEHSERMEIWFSKETVKLSLCRLPWISVTPFFSSLSDKALTGFFGTMKYQLGDYITVFVTFPKIF